jgi:hypothetical protein
MRPELKITAKRQFRHLRDNSLKPVSFLRAVKTPEPRTALLGLIWLQPSVLSFKRLLIGPFSNTGNFETGALTTQSVFDHRPEQ